MINDDAVERAALRAYPISTALDLQRRSAFAVGARWGLAAARAGEAEHKFGVGERCTRCGANVYDDALGRVSACTGAEDCTARPHIHGCFAERGGAEGAVDREALAQAEATRYAQTHAESLGQDAALVGALARGFHDGFLAARGDAAPMVITDQREREACNAADGKHGLRMGAGEPWRHTYLSALGIEVQS